MSEIRELTAAEHDSHQGLDAWPDYQRPVTIDCGLFVQPTRNRESRPCFIMAGSLAGKPTVVIAFRRDNGEAVNWILVADDPMRVLSVISRLGCITVWGASALGFRDPERDPMW